jgi:hypothetical protein
MIDKILDKLTEQSWSPKVSRINWGQKRTEVCTAKAHNPELPKRCQSAEGWNNLVYEPAWNRSGQNRGHLRSHALQHHVGTNSTAFTQSY